MNSSMFAELMKQMQARAAAQRTGPSNPDIVFARTKGMRSTSIDHWKPQLPYTTVSGRFCPGPHCVVEDIEFEEVTENEGE